MSSAPTVLAVSCHCLLNFSDIPIEASCQAVKPVCDMPSVVDTGDGVLGRCDDNTGEKGRGGGVEWERKMQTYVILC